MAANSSVYDERGTFGTVLMCVAEMWLEVSPSTLLSSGRFSLMVLRSDDRLCCKCLSAKHHSLRKQPKNQSR